MAAYVTTPRFAAMAKRYTLKHCARILEMDPAGLGRLYSIAHETLPRQLSKRIGRRKATPLKENAISRLSL